MRRPWILLIAAIILFVVGDMLMTGWTPANTREEIGADGHRTRRAKTDAEIRSDRLKDWLLNGPAYSCYATGAVSLVSFGIVTLLQKRREQIDHERGA